MLSSTLRSWLSFRRGWLLAAVLGISLLSGCASVTPLDYRGQTPTFDLKQYFNGRLTAVGIVFDRSGKMTRRFHVTIDASWKGDVGTLDEHFVYHDGAKQERIWTIRELPEKDGEKRYVGTAGDVIGDYSFDRPLKIGDRLAFADMALYTMCKNNTFNGMPLPDIYLAHADGKIELLKHFGYEDFKYRLGK